MNASFAQNGSGLVAAAQELEANVLQNCQELNVILTSGQKCCAEIHRYFEADPLDVPVKAVLDAILILKKTISFIAEKATNAEQKLSTLKHEFWQESLFPTLTSCCFNEKYVFLHANCIIFCFFLISFFLPTIVSHLTI
jgi:hypothetical protein